MKHYKLTHNKDNTVAHILVINEKGERLILSNLEEDQMLGYLEATNGDYTLSEYRGNIDPKRCVFIGMTRTEPKFFEFE